MAIIHASTGRLAALHSVIPVHVRCQRRPFPRQVWASAHQLAHGVPLERKRLAYRQARGGTVERCRAAQGLCYYLPGISVAGASVEALFDADVAETATAPSESEIPTITSADPVARDAACGFNELRSACPPFTVLQPNTCPRELPRNIGGVPEPFLSCVVPRPRSVATGMRPPCGRSSSL